MDDRHEDQDIPDTRELVRHARAHDADAFPALYERLAPTIYTWASLRLRESLRHLIDPEDVMQEVWYRAFSRFHTYDPERSSFRAWIFRIAELVVVEAFRGLRGRPLPGRGDLGGTPPPDELATDATSVSRRVATDERLRDVIKRLEVLDGEERTLLLYRGLEGLPHEELARRLDVSTETARKRWARLRERLDSENLPVLLLES